MGYLPQDPPLPEGATVLEAVLTSDSAVAKAVQGYEAALRASAVTGGAITKVTPVMLQALFHVVAWSCRGVLLIHGVLRYHCCMNPGRITTVTDAAHVLPPWKSHMYFLLCVHMTRLLVLGACHAGVCRAGENLCAASWGQ